MNHPQHNDAHSYGGHPYHGHPRNSAIFHGPNYGTINVHQTANFVCVMPRRSWPRRHPILTTFLVLVGLGMLVQYWWVAAIGVGVWIGVKALKSREARRQLERSEQQRLIESAHAQNAAFLGGHQFGTYGHFPAPAPGQQWPPR